MHPGIYGSVDVVECKGHHYTTPEKKVVHNGLWREGEKGRKSREEFKGKECGGRGKSEEDLRGRTNKIKSRKEEKSVSKRTAGQADHTQNHIMHSQFTEPWLQHV